MISAEHIALSIFPTDEKKAAFLAAINQQTADLSLFAATLQHFLESGSEDRMQRILAPFLRAAAIEFLRDDQSSLAQRLRQSILEASVIDENGQRIIEDNLTWDAYLAHQSQDKIYATYREAIAITALLGLNVAYTVIEVCYRQDGDHLVIDRINEAPTKNDELISGAPTVRLYCQGSNLIDGQITNSVQCTHWYVYNNEYKRTIADGNCLYHAIAQWLRMLLLSTHSNNEMLIAGLLNTQDQPALNLSDISSNHATSDSLEHTDRSLALNYVRDDALSFRALHEQFELITVHPIPVFLQNITDFYNNLRKTSAHNILDDVELEPIINCAFESIRLLKEAPHPAEQHIALFFETSRYLMACLSAQTRESARHKSINQYRQNLEQLRAHAQLMLQSNCDDFKALGTAILQWEPIQKPFLKPHTTKFPNTSRSNQFLRTLYLEYISPTFYTLALSLLLSSVIAFIACIILAFAPHTFPFLTNLLAITGLDHVLIALAQLIGLTTSGVRPDLALSAGFLALSTFGLGWTVRAMNQTLQSPSNPAVSRGHCCVWIR